MRNLILFLSVVVAGTFPVSAEPILPDAMHALPVLIQIPLPGGTNYGTGIYLSESNKIFLVTAAHCLFNQTNTSELINSNAILSSFAGPPNPTAKVIYGIDLKRIQQLGQIKQHPDHDVAVIYIGFSGERDTNGFARTFFYDYVRQLCDNNLRLTLVAVNDSCVVFTNIPDGSETYVLGYPVELLNNPVSLKLNQVDFDSPLIRKGIISQRNQKTTKLILDSGVYGGNSGGPVMIVGNPSSGVTTYKVGGLITQFVAVETRVAPQLGVTNSVLANSGYGVAEPIDYAIELMRQF
jgi:hypothetical protein